MSHLGLLTQGASAVGQNRLLQPDFQHAVIVGGGGMSVDAYRRVIELAGGPKNARVGIITAAADGGRHTVHAKGYTNTFKRLGVEDVQWIPVHEDAKEVAYDPKMVAEAQKLNVLFLGGGSQNRLIGSLVDQDGRDTPLLSVLKQRFQSKQLIVAGDSAGAASQAVGPAITSGDSYESLTRPSQPTEEVYNGFDLSYNPRGGLGFFPFAIDTHFSERGREGRMLKFATETGSDLAFGVDEGTALVLTDPLDPSRRNAQVVGEGGVAVFNLRDAHVRETDGYSAENVDVSYLTHGDYFDPEDRRSTFAPNKSASKARGISDKMLAALQEDIFGAPHVTHIDDDDPAVVAHVRDTSRKNPGAFRAVATTFASGDLPKLDAMAHESQQHGSAVVSVELLKSDWTQAVASHRGDAPSYKGVAMNVKVSE